MVIIKYNSPPEGVKGQAFSKAAAAAAAAAAESFNAGKNEQ